MAGAFLKHIRTLRLYQDTDIHTMEADAQFLVESMQTGQFWRSCTGFA